jgi:hypothetical protein
MDGTDPCCLITGSSESMGYSAAPLVRTNDRFSNDSAFASTSNTNDINNNNNNNRAKLNSSALHNAGFILKFSKIKMFNKIGAGAFGEVYR